MFDPKKIDDLRVSDFGRQTDSGNPQGSQMSETTHGIFSAETQQLYSLEGFKKGSKLSANQTKE